MDPMSALAIVALVVQFVDIGARLITKGRQEQKQARDRNALLAEHSGQLSSLNKALHEAAEDLKGTTDSLSTRRLHDICDECDSLAAELVHFFAQPASSKQKPGKYLDVLLKRLNSFKLSVMEVALLSIW
jgi:hypothetical protein